MSAFELFYTILMGVLCAIMGFGVAKENVAIGFIAFLAFFMIPILPVALLNNWPRRFKTYRMKKGMTNHKHVTYHGFFTNIEQFKTGKMVTKSVNDGYTREIGGSFRVYEHYHYETSPQYDGFIGMLHLCDQDGNDTGKIKIIRTFPKDKATLPDSNQKPITISCVIDDDGTEYYNNL